MLAAQSIPRPGGNYHRNPAFRVKIRNLRTLEGKGGVHMDRDQENESKNSGQTAQNVVDFGSAMTRTAHGTV